MRAMRACSIRARMGFGSRAGAEAPPPSRASSASEAGAYCAKQGGRARMLGMAPGNIEVMFECVKN